MTGLRRHRLARPSPPVVGLALAVAGSAALILALGSNLTFFREDWELLVDRQGWTADSLMRPFLEHIVLAPALVYKLLVEIFGIESALPFRIAQVAVFSISVVLLFLWLRRRVGPWAALLGAVSVAFLGAAYEDLLWPFQIGYFGSVAAGLGMLLALDRDDARGDATACALLVVSLSFSSLGVAFAAGALVDLLLGRRPLRPRLYLLAVPLALFAAWWVGWGREADSAIMPGNFVEAPRYVFESIAAGLAALVGLTGADAGGHDGQLLVGRLLAGLALFAGCLRVLRLRAMPRDVAVALAIALTFWTLAAVNQTLDRPPDASRYQYPSAVFLLLIGAGLLRGVRIERRALLAGAAVTALAATSGVALLYRQYDERWLPASESLRASLAGIEIVGDGARDDLTVSFPPNMTLPAADYLALVRDAGSPAYSERELLASDEPSRGVADRTVAGALGLRLEPSPGIPDREDCRLLRSGGGLELPAAAVTFAATGGAADLSLSRFSSGPAVPLGRVVPSAPMRLRIPADLSVTRWRVHARGGGRVAVCAAPAPPVAGAQKVASRTPVAISSRISPPAAKR